MLSFECVEKCQTRGAHERAAAERGSVQAGRKCRGKLLARQESAERQAACERFGNHNDVRQSRKPLVGKGATRAAKPTLNFIGNQRGALLRCQFAGAFPKCVADGKNST